MAKLTILQKLNKIQTEVHVPKNQYNSFGKYKFRNCDDILEALKPTLKELGCVVLLSDDVINIDGRYYVQSTATLKDEEGEISTSAFAREEDSKKGFDSSQLTGSTSSYSRKYALNGLLALDDNKDSDETNKPTEKTPQQQTQPKEEVKWLSEANLKKVLGVKDKEKVQATIDMYSKKPYAMKKEYRTQLEEHLKKLK